MSDIFREVDEDLRREQYKAIWNKYGNLIIAVAILIVVAAGGYRGWEYWQNRQAEQSGDKFIVALTQADEGKKAEATATLDELARGGTGAYPYFARMREAAMKIADGDTKGAAAAFDAVASDGSAPSLIRDVARLRAALALSDTATLADLEARLGEMAKPGAPFRHTAREILALAAWRTGDFAKATANINDLNADAETPQATRQRAALLQQLIRAKENPPPASASTQLPRPQPRQRSPRRANSAGRACASMSATPSRAELAKVAIVGRPNVGKSTLFNRLVGRRVALVDDTPGVTRDRREGEARIGGLRFIAIDTAGMEDADAGSLAGRMRAQTEAAVRDADLSLFLTDAKSGLTPTDKWFAALLRKVGRPVIPVANKAEGRSGEAGYYETFELGFGEPVAISAEHGEGLTYLHDAIREHLGKSAPADDAEPEADKPLQVAVIGRPNVGKSTLINRIVGEERLLTGPEAGITRDSIAVDWTWKGRRFQLSDTAGLRRKARIQEKLEKLSVGDALRAIRFAETVILVIDVTQPFEKQDLQLADLVEREGRSIVIALDKWDLVTKGQRPAALKSLRDAADRLLPQLHGVALAPVSGLNGEGTRQAAGGSGEGRRDMEPARVDVGAEPLAGRGDRPPPAAGGQRQASAPALHDAAQGAPAVFRRVLLTAGRAARRVSPLSDERPPRSVRHAGHADPPDVAQGRQPLRRQETKAGITTTPRFR